MAGDHNLKNTHNPKIDVLGLKGIKVMRKKKYPILEYDPAKTAVIEPSAVFRSIDISEYCVICCYKSVVDKVAAEYGAKLIYEDKGCYGTNPFYQFEFNNRPVVFFQPYAGAPLAAAFFEIAIALGCRKFVACGGAGVLDRDIPVGHFIVLDAAIRDEGTSYHYIEPARVINADKRAVDAITSTLDEHNELYTVARTWTTDGLFRETKEKVAMRKKEKCATVDMEAAALFAVAKFRGAQLGYILFGGDDVSGEDWDQRREVSRTLVSEKIFWLSVEACLRL